MLNITFLHSFKSRILKSLAYLLNLTHLNICWAQEDAFSLHAFNHDFLLTYKVLSHHCFYVSKSDLSLEAQVKSSAWHASSINVLTGSYFNFWNPIKYSISLLAVLNVLLCILALCAISAFAHVIWISLELTHSNTMHVGSVQQLHG